MRPAARDRASGSRVGVSQQQQLAESGGGGRRAAGAYGSRALSAAVPSFYFPMGRPLPASEIDAQMRAVGEALAAPEFRGGVSREQMPAFVRRARLPLYWKLPLFQLGTGPAAGSALSTSASASANNLSASAASAILTAERFLPAWRAILSDCHDDAARFLRLLVTVSTQQSPARHNTSLNSSANMFWSFANPVPVTQRPSTATSASALASASSRSASRRSSTLRDYLVPDDLIELIQARACNQYSCIVLRNLFCEDY